MSTSLDVSALIKAYPQYGLGPFSPILAEMLKRLETLDNLTDRTVLELGPGNRVELMRFLAQETRVKSIQGVGRSILWPWTRRRAFIQAHVVNARLLDFFAAQQSATP